MTINAAYKIIPDLRLVLELFTSNVTVSESLGLKNKEVNDKDYKSDFNFIVSLVDIHLPSSKIDVSEIQKYIETIKSNSKILGKRKSALLTDKPNQVVMGTFYEMATKELPMNFKIFSTIGNALKWLGIPNEFENIITENFQNLRKSLQIE